MTHHPKPDITKSNPCPPCPKTASAPEKLIYALGIGLGSGLPQRAPGTWGTVGGLILGVLAGLLGGVWVLFVLVVLGLLVGSFVCGKTSQLMGVHDDPHIVFDEWVGIWIGLIPVFFLLHGDVYAALGSRLDGALEWVAFCFDVVLVCIVFRVLDIVKPFPIAWVDRRVSGGWGILLDDVLAGIMTAIACGGFLLWLYRAFIF